MVDTALWRVIERGLTCDITTIGRKSGIARRIEIWYFVVDGTVYISGTPGHRDWLANMQANPLFTFHVNKERRPICLHARSKLSTSTSAAVLWRILFRRTATLASAT
ncbi:nitroreductase family deazaflavin-dependent oxidoreductase [Candidatus Gracilibacteria bacterium]|nr:nitroreductase family deazaflavin-dependent oxidoreductase [Candidatus Gracilibacteria bacterium]